MTCFLTVDVDVQRRVDHSVEKHAGCKKAAVLVGNGQAFISHTRDVYLD